MFSRKMYTKAGIALCMVASMSAVSFAGTSISDVPASANENRTIQKETTLYTDSCDISQNLWFYDKSPVYLRIAQPKWPVSYVFDKTQTYVRVYGGNVFAGNLRFPYISNFVPSTTVDQDISNILTVDTTGSTFVAQTTTPRNKIAGQIVTKNVERSIIQNNNWSSLNYYYRWSSNNSLHNGILKVILNPNVTQKTSCTNYFIARCGDGIIDKPTGTTDWNGWIVTENGEFVKWHTRSTGQNEVCDDGTLNGTPWHCKMDCSGGGTWIPWWPSCSLTASSSSVEPGQSITLNASYTSGTNAIFSPALSWITFTYPTRSNNNIIATPTTTTTYSLTVNGVTGTTPAVCNVTVDVWQHFWCSLNISPSITTTGQILSIGWNVHNGNFFWTYIEVSPALGWARPHRINANQYNGITHAITTQTGDYIFSMMVNNNEEQSTCTWIVHVVDPMPSTCSLTTTTPTIMPWQTAILNASYTNAFLAIMTPNITGLNFIYPHRNNTNIAVTPTTTTTYTLNTLSAFGSWATCTSTINVINTWLTLSKSLVTNVLYHSGELVSFQINFANQWPSTVNNVVLSDYLPAGLEYVSSQIFGVSPYRFGTGINGGNQFIEFSWFSLLPGQQWSALIVGRFKWYEYAKQTLNNAFLEVGDWSTGASAIFYAYTPSGNASIVKTSNKTAYYPGEDARFTLAVTNNGPDTISNITLTDDWPNTTCVTLDGQWISNMLPTMISSIDPYVWRYSESLAVGQTIYLYVTWHINATPSCVGTYINNASTSYTINGAIQTGIAQPLIFTVSTTPNSTMSFEKKVVQYGNNVWDPVVFELLYQNNGTAIITSYDIVDYWPGTLHFVSASPMPTTNTPTTGGSLLRWMINTPLLPGNSGKIIINGTIK